MESGNQFYSLCSMLIPGADPQKRNGGGGGGGGYMLGLG